MELYDQKVLVKKILEFIPHARDDDYVLYAAVIRKQYGLRLGQISVMDWFEKMRSGEFPSIESIGRARRKVQQENPELRGRMSAVQRREKAEIDYRAFYSHDFY